MMDQILLGADGSRKHGMDEPVGECMFDVQQSTHLLFFDHQDSARSNGSRGSNAQRLAGEAALAKEIPGTQHRNHGFLAGCRYNRKLDAAFLDVQNTRCGIALSEDSLVPPIFHNLSLHTSRIEKSLHIKTALGLNLYLRSHFHSFRPAEFDAVLLEIFGGRKLNLKQALYCGTLSQSKSVQNRTLRRAVYSYVRMENRNFEDASARFGEQNSENTVKSVFKSTDTPLQFVYHDPMLRYLRRNLQVTGL